MWCLYCVVVFIVVVDDVVVVDDDDVVSLVTLDMHPTTHPLTMTVVTTRSRTSTPFLLLLLVDRFFPVVAVAVVADGTSVIMTLTISMNGIDTSLRK